mgnify:CR=1 FL=1
MTQAPPPAVNKPAPSGLAARSASGFILFVLQSVIGRFINLGAQLFLAYLLVPEDFGLIGLAYTVLAFSSVFGTAGVREVLIHHHQRWKVWAWPGLFVSVGFGLAAGSLALAMAPLGAWFYDDHRLLGMISVLAMGAFLRGFGVVPQARLQGLLRFKAAASLNLLLVFLQPLLTVLFAALGFGPYSFVWPIPITLVIFVTVGWVVAKPMPHSRSYTKATRMSFRSRTGPQRLRRRRIAIARIRRMTYESVQLIGLSFASQLITQIDYIVLGYIVQPKAVGHYYFAFNLSTQSLRLVTLNLSHVLLPVISQIQRDTHRTQAAFIRVARMTAAVGIPLSFLQAALARPAFELFLEPQWLPAVPLLQILSLCMGPRLIAGIGVATLKGRGKFKTLLMISYSAAGLLLIAILIIASLSPTTLSVAVVVGIWSALYGPFMTSATLKCLGSRLTTLANIYIPALIVGLISVGIPWWLLEYKIVVTHPLTELLLAATSFIVLFVVIAPMCIRSEYYEMRTRLSPLLKRIARSSSHRDQS